MVARRTRQLPANEQAELWRQWRAGQSQARISQALGLNPNTVFTVIHRRGGVAPIEARRAPLSLTVEEREEILRGLGAGLSLRAIARAIDRPASTISREVARNGGRNRYRAGAADRRAWRQAKRPKRCKLSTQPRLRMLVTARLAERWSPQQISAWLKREHPDTADMQVSHETIYRTLFIQARNALKKELVSYLRARRSIRRPKQHVSRGQHSRIPDAISIRERPASVEDRAVPGHWEGDLLIGSPGSCIATLVERQTRYVMLVRLDNKQAETVARALAKHVLKLPSELRKSLTWDRGAEMAHHTQFTIATDVQVYFCDPQSPWQRGSNENTNGLLRQYFPKGTDLSGHSQAYLDKVARQLNGRPRQTLGWMTPAEKLEQVLH
jgi:IS30 family transposase